MLNKNTVKERCFMRLKRRIITSLICTFIIANILSGTNIIANAAVKPGKITLGKQTVTPTYVTINWLQASNAVGYEVYYKKSTASDYTKKTTTGNSLVIKGLSKNTAYNIWIRVYNGSVYGDYKSFDLYTYVPDVDIQPTSLTASGVQSIIWTIPSTVYLNGSKSSISGFQTFKKNGSSYSLIKTLGKTETQCPVAQSPFTNVDYGLRFYIAKSYTDRDKKAFTVNHFSN